MRIKNHFHINGFAHSLALKQRIETTRKWPNLPCRCKCSWGGALCDKTKMVARETRNGLNLKNITIPAGPPPVLSNISVGKRVTGRRAVVPLSLIFMGSSSMK